MGTMTKAQRTEAVEAMARLREMLKPGDELTTILRHVSRSGMMRHIDVYRFGADGSRDYLSGLVARACDWRTAADGSLKVCGCGMDMGFEVVYKLGATLWPVG